MRVTPLEGDDRGVPGGGPEAGERGSVVVALPERRLGAVSVVEFADELLQLRVRGLIEQPPVELAGLRPLRELAELLPDTPDGTE